MNGLARRRFRDKRKPRDHNIHQRAVARKPARAGSGLSISSRALIFRVLRSKLPGAFVGPIAALYISLLGLSSLSVSQVAVTTQHNDGGRTGQNLSETVLNTSNVNVNTFGKLFSLQVDGQIYAQPLYLPNLDIQGTIRNVVYVATEHNSVYAFDADNASQVAPLWQVNLGTSVPSQDICTVTGDTDPDDCPYEDLTPEIGITSTPVIDPNTAIMYVVAKTKNNNDSSYHFFLHALDVRSGAEQLGGPIEIIGQVNGGGAGSSGGILAFTPLFHIQRPGLLLLNGILYIAFGSVGDIGAFHGWIMSYEAATLLQTTVFCVTPDGSDGGIWQAGQGLVADNANNIYVMTGDGTFDANVSGRDYGDSFLKLSTSNGLMVSDYFTPSNQASLFSGDVDLGSGGPVAIPQTSLLVGIGKDKLFRVVDSNNMGQFNASLDNDVQEFTVALSSYFGSPVYWNSPNNGPVVYVWGPQDFLKAYKLVGGQFQTTPVTQSTLQNSTGFSNSAPMSVSANSNLVGSGIVWASASFSGVATGAVVPGILRAFDATDLTNELWDSKQNEARDDVGNYAKFSPPTIANGKVYLATFSNQLLVYGLLSDFSLSASPASSSVIAGQSGASTIMVTAANGFNSTVTLTCPAGLPSGASCSFVPPSVTPGLAPVTSTLTIATSATTPAATSNVTVTGTSGSLSHDTTVSLTVAVPDFTIAASALSPASVSAGGSATSTITIAPTNGFNGTVSFACSSITGGGPPAPTCSFNPSSVANGSGTPKLTISTTAAHASLTSPSRVTFYAMWLPIGGLALWGTSFTARKKRFWSVVLGCLVFSGLIFLAACGGSSSSGGGGGGQPGTPAGTYTITITATSGSLTHAARVSLTVR
jgi:hypothetical protein